MKVIDLLNLIASGKTPPRSIRYLGKIYYYNGIDYTYRDLDDIDDLDEYILGLHHLMDNVALSSVWLNEEVEVLDHE